MAKKKDTGIVVIGAAFVDIKGYPYSQFIPGGRNSGHVVEVHGGVARNIVEDIANVELRPTFVTVVEKRGVSNDVVDKLEKHKCNTEYIKRADGGLGTWLAVFDNTGDVVASISKRPDLSRIEDILDDKGDEIFSAADSIAHLQVKSNRKRQKSPAGGCLSDPILWGKILGQFWVIHP